jgi:hypothetical protein
VKKAKTASQELQQALDALPSSGGTIYLRDATMRLGPDLHFNVKRTVNHRLVSKGSLVRPLCGELVWGGGYTSGWTRVTCKKCLRRRLKKGRRS